MNQHPATSPVNPFDALGLPDTWQPVPVKYRFGKVQAATPSGVVMYHTIIIDGPQGRTAIAFDAEDLRTFVDLCEQQLSGIAVARIVPPNGNGPL